MANNLEVLCPCCESTLVIDRVTGEVLLHKKKAAGPGQSFEAMVSQLAASKSEMEKKFDKGIESQKNRGRILEERFREAIERADKDDKPPVNPFDLD